MTFFLYRVCLYTQEEALNGNEDRSKTVVRDRGKIGEGTPKRRVDLGRRIPDYQELASSKRGCGHRPNGLGGAAVPFKSLHLVPKNSLLFLLALCPFHGQESFYFLSLAKEAVFLKRGRSFRFGGIGSGFGCSNQALVS